MKKYLLLILLFTFIGCATNPFTVPVTNPEERIFYHHFSFLPPNGSNWKTTERPVKKNVGGSPMATFMFRKQLFEGKPTTASENETFVAGAQIHKFHRDENINEEMLVKYLKHYWTFPSNDPRYKMINLKYSLDNSYDTPCFRYDAKAEDRKVPGFSDSIFIFHNWGLMCVHPEHRNEIYTLNASQRYFKGESPTNLESEFEPLLNSMQFN
jgi:hypothetical protein